MKSVRARSLAIRGGVLSVACAALLAGAAQIRAATDRVGGEIGAYRLADGGVVALVPHGSGGLRLVDYASGAFRTLTARSANVLVGGPGVAVLSPVRIRVQLSRGPGGEVRALTLDGRAARRIQLVAAPAEFGDRSVRLVGTLLRPSRPGPFPAVVLVPGSERATRDTYDQYAYFFAAQGFAVLSYDKRGVGESGGVYVRAATGANLRNQAADALAGVDWLRRQANVDAGRIGLTGGSQAGWVIALAAAESSLVRFAAIQSGPAMSVGRQLAYARLTRAGAADPPPTEARIQALLARTTATGFDPRAALAALRIPVLWQLGSVDKRMYTPETVADLGEIAAAGRHEFTVRVYPGGAHSLRRTRHGLIAEEIRSPGFVPGLFRDLAAWLRDTVGSDSSHG